MNARIFSRFIIIFPLVLLFLALYVHYSTPDKEPIIQAQKLASTPTIIPTQKSLSKSLDLIGPYHCIHTGTDLNTEVFIKDKQVFASIQEKNTEFVLLKKDCIYSWNISSSKGTKVCGMGQYLSMYEMMTSMNLMKMEDFLGPLLKSGITSSQTGKLESLIPNFSKSCKKEEVNEAVFVIPSGINFTVTKVVTTPTF